MKFFQMCFVLFVLGCSLNVVQAVPVSGELALHQVAILIPEYVAADLPASTDNPEESIVAPVPLTLLDIENDDKSSADGVEESQRSTRGLLLGGHGGFGGLGGKFGSLGLGFKGFGGLGGFGGFHGLGLGGFKPLFGKHFG